MIENGPQNINSFHLAGIVPVAGQPLEFEFPWHDSLMPIGLNYLALERAVVECAMAGCETIWVVCHNDMQPLIRHTLGEWVFDPASLNRGPFPSEQERKVPIFYVPIHPRDRDRRDCLGWSVLYGAVTAYHLSKQLSKWVIPDRFYVAFPYGVYPVEILREHRKKISSRRPFCLTYNNESVIKGHYLGFTFDAEDFKASRDVVKKQGTKMMGENGRRLPLQEQYSARHFPLDKVFECVIIDKQNQVEVPWYHNIDSWVGYKQYLNSQESEQMIRPERLKYHECNPIGVADNG